MKKNIDLIVKILILTRSKRFLGPSIFIHNLSFFLWSEIVFNIEKFSNLWNGHSLDKRGNLGTSKL